MLILIQKILKEGIILVFINRIKRMWSIKSNFKDAYQDSSFEGSNNIINKPLFNTFDEKGIFQ